MPLAPSCRLRGSLHPSTTLSGYEGPKLALLQAGSRPRPWAAGDRDREGPSPPLYRPSCRGPRAFPPGQRPLQSPSGAWRLATPSPPACPAASHAYGFGLRRRAGFAPAFHQPSSRGSPLPPFPRRPPSIPATSPIPGGYVRIEVEGWAYPPRAPLSAAPARISPRTRLPRLSPLPAATGRRVLVQAPAPPG